MVCRRDTSEAGAAAAAAPSQVMPPPGELNGPHRAIEGDAHPLGEHLKSTLEPPSAAQRNEPADFVRTNQDDMAVDSTHGTDRNPPGWRHGSATVLEAGTTMLEAGEVSPSSGDVPGRHKVDGTAARAPHLRHFSLERPSKGPSRKRKLTPDKVGDIAKGAPSKFNRGQSPELPTKVRRLYFAPVVHGRSGLTEKCTRHALFTVSLSFTESTVCNV